MPIAPEMIEWFQENSDFGIVFGGLTGNPVHRASEHGIFRKAAKEIGIDINLYNVCLQSWASQMRDAGATIEDILTVLGHTNIQTTQRYAHPSFAAGMRTIGKVKRSDHKQKD